MLAVETGKMISISWKVFEGETLLDERTKEEPLLYVHGKGQLLEAIETSLEGLSSGTKKELVLQPEQAFGLVRQELRVSTSRDQFPAGAELKPGVAVKAQVATGGEVVLVVQKVEGDTIHLDGNHPWAGKTLSFQIEVLGVREATKEELADDCCSAGTCEE